jgi:hypothetical protein
MAVLDSKPPAGSFIRPLQEVNEHCITLLAAAARAPRPGVFPLALELGDLLRASTPEVSARAARTPFLLVDLEFANDPWWHAVQNPQTRETPPPAWRGGFPRTAAIPLTRATLTLAWHVLRTHPQARCLLGMSPPVAEVVVSLSLADLERIAARRFRHVRPRWEDRPGLWRQLLQSSHAPDIRRIRDFSLRGLQLIAGELL